MGKSQRRHTLASLLVAPRIASHVSHIANKSPITDFGSTSGSSGGSTKASRAVPPAIQSIRSRVCGLTFYAALHTLVPDLRICVRMQQKRAYVSK